MPDRSATCELLIGILLAEAGIGLLGFGKWDPMETGARMPFYAAGFLSLAIGMFLIWKEPLSVLMIGDESSPDGTVCKLKVGHLGRIDLNGYYLEAYEEKTISAADVSACDPFLRSVRRAKQVLFAT